MISKPGNGHSGAIVLTICSGKGGVGKSTVIRALVEELKGKFRVAVIDGALGVTGISSVYGVFPEENKSYEAFLEGKKQVSECICKVNGFSLVPSGVNKNVDDRFRDRDFSRIRELIQNLSAENDVIIIDSASGLDLGLYEYLNLSDMVLIVVTADPQSVTDGYAICKLFSSNYPKRLIAFLLNMAESENDYLDFNYKMGRITEKFLGRIINAMGFLKFDRFFMKSPGDVEFGSMIGNDNRNNMEELVEKLETYFISNIDGRKNEPLLCDPVLPPVSFQGEMKVKKMDDSGLRRAEPFQPGGEL